MTEPTHRTIPPRDIHVLAAYKSFTPPLGNTHDVIFAAIRHGYDVGVTAATEKGQG